MGQSFARSFDRWVLLLLSSGQVFSIATKNGPIASDGADGADGAGGVTHTMVWEKMERRESTSQ